MELTFKMILLVIAGTFLAAFTDAIAGGGGIISLPTYLIAGLPTHLALGTNKLSSGLGTIASTFRYVRQGYVNWRFALPTVLLAIIGSHFGTRLQLLINERYLKYLLVLVLPVVAAVVLRKRSFSEVAGSISPHAQLGIVCAAALAIGTYDGFYGPGTGTFLLLAFCGTAKMDVRTASGNVKLVNLASNFASLFTAMAHHRVFFALGLIGAAFSFLGHWLGSGLAIRSGTKIVRPVVIVVLALLILKLLLELLGISTG